jgi:hypothetical protein
VATAGTSAQNGTIDPAIKAVIQRANDEQQQAFAQDDPTRMRDTATNGYYNELVQTNADLARNGVTKIALTRLEWGPITYRTAAQAQVTTFETWRTSYRDGSEDESRDRNLYSMVLESGNWKIQADVHPDSGLDQSPEPPDLATPGPSPVLPIPFTRARSGQSRNWSGYSASGGNFTAVSATWTVPKVTSPGGFSSDATWVGIGGERSRDLIQAGTEASIGRSGQPSYQAWIEMLPGTSRPVSLDVSAGDSVTVSITNQGKDQWQIALVNNTTGKRYETTETYTSSFSSADWIEEAPSGGRRTLPLDDFGTVTLTKGSTVKDGKRMTIAQAGARSVTMIDASGRAIATPSSLSQDGDGFSVQRTNVQPVQRPSAQSGR